MSRKDWKRGSFRIATKHGITEREGLIRDGLGLYEPSWQKWSLTHLRTGHCVFLIPGTITRAIRIAEEALKCGNWDFTGFDGWMNRDPELCSRIRALLHQHDLQIGIKAQHEQQARDIAASIGEGCE